MTDTVVELHIDGPGIADFWPAQRVRGVGENEEEAREEAIQRALDDEATFGADTRAHLTVKHFTVLES